jgi:hypothetical protein
MVEGPGLLTASCYHPGRHRLVWMAAQPTNASSCDPKHPSHRKLAISIINSPLRAAQEVAAGESTVFIRVGRS